MKKIILFISISSILLACSGKTKDIWFPKITQIKKDTSFSAQNTYNITIYSIQEKNSLKLLKKFPIYDNFWNDKKKIYWQQYVTLNPTEKKYISDFFQWQKLDSLNYKKDSLYITAVYSINTNTLNDTFWDFMKLGIIDKSNNKFYLLEWYR